MDGWWWSHVGWFEQPVCDHHVPVMWFRYGQRDTTIREQRSVTTGCGKECFPSQISSCLRGGLLTLSHGRTVYAGRMETWTQETEPVLPPLRTLGSNLRKQVNNFIKWSFNTSMLEPGLFKAPVSTTGLDGACLTHQIIYYFAPPPLSRKKKVQKGLFASFCNLVIFHSSGVFFLL